MYVCVRVCVFCIKNLAVPKVINIFSCILSKGFDLPFPLRSIIHIVLNFVCCCEVGVQLLFHVDTLLSW